MTRWVDVVIIVLLIWTILKDTKPQGNNKDNKKGRTK